jgi:hypothetical protein
MLRPLTAAEDVRESGTSKETAATTAIQTLRFEDLLANIHTPRINGRVPSVAGFRAQGYSQLRTADQTKPENSWTFHLRGA